MANAYRDQNNVATLLAVSSVDGFTPIRLFADPVTHRLLVDLPGGTGTVTDVSIVTANGISGTVATSTTTPAITLTLGAITPTSVNGNILTTGTGTITITGTKTLTVSDTATVSGTNTGDDKTGVTGLLKGNGTLISAALAGTDYLAPPSGTAILKANSGGALANAVSGTDYAPGTSSLATGILKSTTTSGALSIAVSGTDIKTINSTSILGAGNITASVINWLGAYNGATSYIANDAVSISGNSYICILATGGGIPPPNLTYWNILAQQGDPGVAGVSGALTTPFTSQTSVTVTHNFNAYPAVQVIDGGGELLIPLTVTHTSVNAFTVTFVASTSGNIISTIGGVNTSVVTKSSNYSILSTDSLILCTASLTLTLPATTGLQGKIYYIKNTTGSAVSVVTTGGKTIDGQSSQNVTGLNSTMQVITDGTNWFII